MSSWCPGRGPLLSFGTAVAPDVPAVTKRGRPVDGCGPRRCQRGRGRNRVGRRQWRHEYEPHDRSRGARLLDRRRTGRRWSSDVREGGLERTSWARRPKEPGDGPFATSGSCTCSVPTRSCSGRCAISGRRMTQARPLLAGLCALARDAVFRASSAAIIRRVAGRHADVGQTWPRPSVSSSRAATARAPSRRSAGTRSPRGSRLAISPRPAGPTKVRVRAICRPADVAYALLLGHLQGRRGRALFDTLVGPSARSDRRHTSSILQPQPRSRACWSSVRPAASSTSGSASSCVRSTATARTLL